MVLEITHIPTVIWTQIHALNSYLAFIFCFPLLVYATIVGRVVLVVIAAILLLQGRGFLHKVRG
jgi:hypothetical protein